MALTINSSAANSTNNKRTLHGGVGTRIAFLRVADKWREYRRTATNVNRLDLNSSSPPERNNRKALLVELIRRAFLQIGAGRPCKCGLTIIHLDGIRACAPWPVTSCLRRSAAHARPTDAPGRAIRAV